MSDPFDGPAPPEWLTPEMREFVQAGLQGGYKVSLYNLGKQR